MPPPLRKQTKPQARQKMAKLGVSNLTDTELLAVILGSGTKQFPVSKVAQLLLKRFSLTGMAKINAIKLLELQGIGVSQASRLIACIEFGRRLYSPPTAPVILSSNQVVDQASAIRNHHREHLLVLYLNARQELMSKEVICVGGLNYTNIHPREVFTPAVLLPAAYIILIHNHPSGHVDPSQEDLEVTERIEAAGLLLGITVLDHIIVTKDSYFSFKERGLL